MIRVLFALDRPEERLAIAERITDAVHEIALTAPSDPEMASRLVGNGRVDVVLTDLEFNGGALVEWLFMWSHPFILLVDADQVDRAAELVTDQFSTFVVRDAEHRYREYLPLLIKRTVSIKASVDRHNSTLRMTEQRFEELVQALPDIIYALDPDGRIQFVNESVRRLGWSPGELIGRHYAVLLEEGAVEQVGRDHVLERFRGTTTGPQQAPKLFDERRTGARRTEGLEIRLRRKNESAGDPAVFGSVISYGEVNASGFAWEEHSPARPGSVGIIRDITARIEGERRIAEALREKETLLAEIHHRIKNNLQVVASLLNLHAAGVRDERALSRFNDAQLQIQSMALIHEHLYRNEAIGRIDTERYVTNLCEQLERAFGGSAPNASVVVEADRIPISLKRATPLALLLNELVSNSLKHAFPNGRRGTVRVSVKQRDAETAEVAVRDDGVGMPADADATTSDSLGLVLIGTLADQLEGEIEVIREQGTTVRVTFPVGDGDPGERTALLGSDDRRRPDGDAEA